METLSCRSIDPVEHDGWYCCGQVLRLGDGEEMYAPVFAKFNDDGSLSEWRTQPPNEVAMDKSPVILDRTVPAKGEALR